MGPTRPVAKKTTKMSLDDEIAHLRDLDLHGLRARWKCMFTIKDHIEATTGCSIYTLLPGVMENTFGRLYSA